MSGILESVNWGQFWNGAAVTIAAAALAVSWRANRRVALSDKRVTWRVERDPTDVEAKLCNDGPADALDVRIVTTKRGEPQEPVEQPVFHAGSRVWLGQMFPPDEVRVTWRGGPEHGWSTHV